jgi:C-terminal processing protease CtpA/Prc
VQPDVVVPIQAADFAAGRDPQRDRAIADVTAQIGP